MPPSTPGPVKISNKKDGGPINFIFFSTRLTQPLDPLLDVHFNLNDLFTV